MLEISISYLLKASVAELYEHTLFFKILILFRFFFFRSLMFFPLRSCLSTICPSLNSTAGSQQLSQESVPVPAAPHIHLWSVCWSEQGSNPHPTINSYLPSLLPSLVPNPAHLPRAADLASGCGNGEITLHSAVPSRIHSSVP